MSQTNRVVVIGYRGTRIDVDNMVIEAVCDELMNRRLSHLAVPLIEAALLDSFDMSRCPERGDGLDAIGPGTEVVVALNLYGTSKIPGGPGPILEGDFYSKNNHKILDICMKAGALLFCFGAEQPWFSEVPFKQSRELGFEGSNLVVYEPR